MRNDKKDNLIVEKAIMFAVNVIDFSEQIHALKRFEMASQIFRSGTSIGSNVTEAQNAESKADFIHKFKIAAKEADEVNYWFTLCKVSKHYPNPPMELEIELKSIQLIISKIISSSKKK